MLRQTRFFGLLCGAFTALSIGCSTGTMEDAGPPDSGPPAPVTYTYVIDRLTIDPNDSPESAHTGFNLDTFFSGPLDANGCNHEDFGSLLDRDQNMAGCTWAPMQTTCRGGVDNQLPTLANTIETAAAQDVRMLINDQVNNNKLALIVRVTGVNGVPDATFNDPEVAVKIYLGYPTFSTDCTTVAANREYTISASSIMMGSTDIEAARFSFTGSIVNGRLQVTTGVNGVFELPLPAIMGAQLNLPLHSTQVRATLTATDGVDGNLGGWVSGNDIVNAVTMLAPDYRTVVEGAIGGLVDVQVAGVCEMMTGTMRTFGGIGLGLRLHFVQASIRANMPIQASQAPATCGYEAPGTDSGVTPPRDVMTSTDVRTGG